MNPMVTGKVQCSPFIAYVCGLCGMDCVISESCYKEKILQRKYRKMTISSSFTYDSFVKLHGKKWQPRDCVISKSLI